MNLQAQASDLALSHRSYWTRWYWKSSHLIMGRLFAALVRIGRRALLLTGAFVLTVVFGLSTSPAHVKPPFYSAMAQILPVLLLVAVVEGRYLRNMETRAPFDRFVLTGLFLTPALGELSALTCVAIGHDNVLLRGMTLFAAAITAALLIVYALEGPAKTPASPQLDMLLAASQVRSACEQSSRNGEGNGK
jgi:hypothetical protein